MDPIGNIKVVIMYLRKAIETAKRTDSRLRVAVVIKHAKTTQGEGTFKIFGKVFNLVRGLQKEIDDDPNIAPILKPLKDRAERILKDLESRKTTGLAAMDLLAALATERDAAAPQAVHFPG
jgi:hypothetical protein